MARRFGLAMLAFLFLVLEVVFPFFGFTLGGWGIILFFVFMAVQFLKPQIELNKIEDARPVLKIKRAYSKTVAVKTWFDVTEEGDSDERSGITSSTSSTEWSMKYSVPAGDFSFALAEVENVPIWKGAESTARGVTAETWYFTDRGAQILEGGIFCRWWSEDEPIATNLRAKRAVDIPYGNPAILGLAYKSIDDHRMFGYDIENHRHRALRNQRTGIGARDKYAKVEFKGENVDPFTRWFWIEAKEQGAITVKLVDPPSWGGFKGLGI